MIVNILIIYPFLEIDVLYLFTSPYLIQHSEEIFFSAL